MRRLKITQKTVKFIRSMRVISCISVFSGIIATKALNRYRCFTESYLSHIGWLQAVPFLPSTLQRTKWASLSMHLYSQLA